MKATLKYLSLIFLSIFYSFPLVSCVEKDEIIPINSMSIGKKVVDVKSAGFYYDSKIGIFDFVFSTELLDLSQRQVEEPKGYVMIVDIPENYYGRTIDIKDITNSMDTDGNEWRFFIYCKDSKSKIYYYEKEDLKSGSLMLFAGDDGVAKCVVSVVTKKGEKIECRYSGTIKESDKYLFGWG